MGAHLSWRSRTFPLIQAPSVRSRALRCATRNLTDDAVFVNVRVYGNSDQQAAVSQRGPAAREPGIGMVLTWPVRHALSRDAVEKRLPCSFQALPTSLLQPPSLAYE